MAGRTTLPTLLVAALLLVVRTAAADIFSYTDERGVIHYTNVPSDSRYQVVLAGLEATNKVVVDGNLLLEKILASKD